MNCSTCINKQNPFKTGYCRTMSEEPKTKRCHMTKAEALKAEKAITKFCGDRSHVEYAKRQLKWLNGLES